jgi:hypothetical protein
VPARQVLRADDRVAARAQHAANFTDEMVEALDVFDDLIGVDDVEGGVLEGPPLLEIPRADIEASCLRP